MSIGERITELRKRNELSQAQLASLLTVSRQAISKWENDQASPDTLNLIRLADLLNTDIQYLATGERSAVTVVKEVIKEVEIPVEVEKTVVKEVPIEKIVEVETVIEKPIIRRRIRVKYRDHPVHMLLLGGGCFLFGLLLGILL